MNLFLNLVVSIDYSPHVFPQHFYTLIPVPNIMDLHYFLTCLPYESVGSEVRFSSQLFSQSQPQGEQSRSAVGRMSTAFTSANILPVFHFPLLFLLLWLFPNARLSSLLTAFTTFATVFCTAFALCHFHKFPRFSGIPLFIPYFKYSALALV